MERRDFLKGVLGAGGAVALSQLTRGLPDAVAAAGGNAPQLPRRPYGKSGQKLSIIGFGGIVVMNAEQKHANRAVAKAVERGVNYFDVAPTYGNAELKLGPALQPYRKNAFLACKTTQRDRRGAAKQLKASLKRLRTDHLDLYQLHAITKVKKDVDAAFAKGGAMETFIAAKKDGRVRHLGFSAHSVEAAMLAMDRYDFDSALFPINFACFHAGNFGPQVIEKAKKKNVTILALKPMALRRWPKEGHPDKKKYSKCWYQPLSDRREAELGLRFALSRPVTAVLPPGEESLFWLAMDLAGGLGKPLTAAEETQVKAWAAKTPPMFAYKPQKPVALAGENPSDREGCPYSSGGSDVGHDLA